MKKFSIVGALVAIAAIALVATSAFADNTVWLCGEAKITGTGNNRCLTDSENLEVTFFEDRGAVVASRVECAVGSVTDEGWVGPGSEDETTLVTVVSTSCKNAAKALNLKEEEVTNKCATFEKIKVVGLPWKTLIELVGGVAWDKLLTTTAGYAITCTGVTDTCTNANEASVRLTNLALEGAEFPLVDATFPLKATETRKGDSSEYAKCSLGGAEEGVVRGEILLAALTAAGASQTLEFSTE